MYYYDIYIYIVYSTVHRFTDILVFYTLIVIFWEGLG